MMTKIEFHCPRCQDYFTIVQESAKSSNTMIPSPDISIFKNKFQDHGDHTVFLDIGEGEVRDFKVVPRVRSVFDTFLFDNIQVAKIVNTLLRRNASDTKKMLLYIADPSSYLRFFRELTKQYIAGSTRVTIIRSDRIMIIAHSDLVFAIAEFDMSKRLLREGSESFEATKHLGDFELSSLVIDTSMTTEKKLLKLVKKSKFSLADNVNIILAFDYRKRKEAPLKLREYFLDNYGRNPLELLNYQDTNGLKSIFLQSYYNMLDDPLEARETFEIMQNSFR